MRGNNGGMDERGMENIIGGLKKTKGPFCADISSGWVERDDLCIKKNWKIDRPLAYCRLEILSRHVLPRKDAKMKMFPPRVN